MRNDYEDNFDPEEEFERLEIIQRDNCKIGLLKVENDFLVCEKCDHIFIDKHNVVRISNFEGKKVVDKLGYYRNPYKERYHRRNGQCDLYYKLFPNPSLERNLDVLWKFFGDKMFLFLIEHFGVYTLFDETNVTVYLSAIFKALKKGNQTFNAITVAAIIEILGQLLGYVIDNLEQARDFSKQDDFIVKSVLSFLISVKNLNVSYVDSLIDTYFYKKDI